jgi:hypothetical protein
MMGSQDLSIYQDDLGTGIMWSSKELSEDDYFA